MPTLSRMRPGRTPVAAMSANVEPDTADIVLACVTRQQTDLEHSKTMNFGKVEKYRTG